MSELAFPKPEKRIKPRRRISSTRKSSWGELVRRLDAECRIRVKALALFRCECCGGKPSELDPLDWAHGEPRSVVWGLRWARSNTFALLRSCHRRFDKRPLEFLTWRRSMVSPDAWRVLEETRRLNPKVGIVEMEAILADLRRGIFRQGER